MTGYTHNKKLVKPLVLCSFTLLMLAAFAGVAFNAGATDMDDGWAIIAAPGYSDSQHQSEAQDLRTYLIDNGWDDDNIIFLGDGEAAYDDGVASVENFEDAIEFVSLHSTDDDVVFVAVLDHAVEGKDGYELRFGDDLDEYMSASELDKLLGSIDDYGVMVVNIAGPYSGGFVSELDGSGRIVISDCADDEFYTQSEYTFSEALTDEDADLDADCKVSVEEAHALMMASMDNQSPQMYDPCAARDFVFPCF